VVGFSSNPKGITVDCHQIEGSRQTVPAGTLKRCTLKINECVEVYAGTAGWLPGTVLSRSRSEKEKGYMVRFDGNTEQVVGTYAIRRCRLKKNQSVEVLCDDGHWVPGTIAGPGRSAGVIHGFKVKHSGTMETVPIAAHSLKKCGLRRPDSVEVFCGGDVWRPGTIVGCSTNPIGFNVEWDGTREGILSASALRRCTLLPNESVEVYSVRGKWLPATVVQKTDNPVGYEIKFDATQQEIISTCKLRRCTLQPNDAVKVYAGDAGWVTGTVVSASEPPNWIGYNIALEGSTAPQLVGTAFLARCT